MLMKTLDMLWVVFITCCCSFTFAQSQDKYKGPIIDMHIHAFAEGTSFEAMLGKKMNMALSGKIYTGAESIEALKTETFKKFEEHNIVKAMVSGSNAEEWHNDHPDKVLIGKDHSLSVDELKTLHQKNQLDVIGEVAPNYQGVLPTDKSMAQYFDLAEELNIPIAYHLFPGGPPGGAYFAYPKTRAFQGKPLQLEEILISHPRMKIYIMHGGWPYLEDMKALMYAHPQVYIDIGVINWILTRKEFHHYIKGLVDAGFGKRIMFGTDQMIWPETIDDAIEAVNSADFLTLEQKADIFYNNAARFLELSEEEIAKHKAKIKFSEQ